MIGNILDNTTELYMMKYTFGEIFSSGGATLYNNPSDQTVTYPYNSQHQSVQSFCVCIVTYTSKPVHLHTSNHEVTLTKQRPTNSKI